MEEKEPNKVEENNNKPQTNVGMLILSYFGILSLIPFFTQKDDAYVMKHATHGVDLCIVYFVATIALSIINAILGFTPLAIIGSLLSTALTVGYLVIIIISMVNATKLKDAPLMGKFKIIERFIKK